MQNHLLWERLWTMANKILQLSAWRETFQPSFEKLSTTVVWLQLHHFPMELWDGEILETISSQFGKALKVDEHTLNRFMAKFA